MLQDKTGLQTRILWWCMMVNLSILGPLDLGLQLS